jgi:FkbM family methyltransferase
VPGARLGFRSLLKRQHYHRTAWSVVNIRNWASVIAGGLWRYPVSQIEFRDGLRFKVDAGGMDLSILYEIFGARIYDRQFGDIAPDGTILDIGANIGAFTVRAARDLVPNGRVIAIEPNPKCLQLIEEHLTMNRLHNARLVQGAVASRSGPVCLHVAGYSAGSTLFSRGSDENTDVIVVPAISPQDALLLADSYELVKVDCEGGEFALFYETTPEDWKGTKRIALEYHVGLDHRYAAGPEQLQARIQRLGFKILAALPISESNGYIAAAKA